MAKTVKKKSIKKIDGIINIYRAKLNDCEDIADCKTLCGTLIDDLESVMSERDALLNSLQSKILCSIDYDRMQDSLERFKIYNKAYKYFYDNASGLIGEIDRVLSDSGR